MAAQFWFEWKCHGLVLPYVIGFIMALIMLLNLHAGGRNNDFELPITLGAFLAMPLVQANSLGTGAGRFRPVGVTNKKPITFMAIRPMRSGDMVAAKLLVLSASALLTWSIVLAGTGLWIVASQNTSNVARLVRAYLTSHSAAQGAALLVLMGMLLPIWTWKHLSDGIAFSISGRRWLEATYAFLSAGIIMGLAAVVLRLMGHPDEAERVFRVLPWLIGGAAVAKSAAAIAAFGVALRRGLVPWTFLWSSLGGWAAVTLCAFAATQLALPSRPLAVSRSCVFLGCATLAPLARFPLATLALDWNRHR
jgi:hypothetical protein